MSLKREALRFICDEQLGRLAKWLRIQGFDTLYECPISDIDLIRRAQSEERILLTRDRHLEAKTLWTDLVRIEATDYTKQVKELRGKIKIPKGSLFTRRLECNDLIRTVSKEEIRPRVPAVVYETYREFYACPRCHKIFWRGSHVKNTESKLREMN